MQFYLYKGLKKPLIFFGLKDKFIYYAIGFLVAGIVLAIVFSSFLGFFGNVIGLGIGGVSIWWTFKTQDKKGLYNKISNENELHIIPKNFINKKIIKRKNE